MLAWYHLAVRHIFRRQSKEKGSGREDVQKDCPRLAMEDTVDKAGWRKQLWRQGG